MLYSLKTRFQKFAHFFLVIGLTANQATFLGSFLTATIVLCFYLSLRHQLTWCLLLIPIFVLAKTIANALDGMIAREKHTASPAGELLNELLDVVCDTFMFAALVWVDWVSMYTICILLVLIWAGEFVGVMGRALPGHARRHESIGGGKTERAVWICLIAISLFFNSHTPEFLDSWLLIISVFVFLTTCVRYRKILQVTKSKEHEYVSFTAHGR